MTSKRRKYKTSGMLIVYTLVTCVLLTVCTGCRKGTKSQNSEKQPGIDKDYQQGPLTVHIRADKTKMTIYETLKLELEATIAAGYEVRMPKIDKMLENFGIVDWNNLGDKFDANNNKVTTYRYRLEPFLSGTFPIPAFTFEFSDVNSPENKHELTTEPVDIEVTSLLEGQRDKLVIADIEDVVRMPRKISFWWFVIMGIIGIAAAGIAAACLRRKKHAELIRIFKPAHEIAYDRLRGLISEDLIKKGQIKEFYERISNILRHYIEHRFNLRAPERTTEEFLIELATTQALPVADKNNLAEFLEHCDLVKFARHDPAAEQIQKTFDLVKNFIEKTKSDEKKIDVTDADTKQMIEAGSI